MLVGYYVRHAVVIYDSNNGGWWRYRYCITRQEAEREFEKQKAAYASIVQMIHVEENAMSGEQRTTVIKESRIDVGSKTFRA